MASYLGFTLGDATDGVLGTYTSAPTVLLGGANRTTSMLRDSDFALTFGLGQPGVCRVTAYGAAWTPAKGQALEVRDDGASGSVRWFAGTVTRVSRSIEQATTRLLYSLTAQDPRWLLDRYATVTGWWASKGINTIARDIIARFTDGAFSLGYAPASLGDLDYFEAVEERVSVTLGRLAAAAGAYLEVGPDRRVHLFTTPDHQSAGVVTVTNSSNNVGQFTWSDDLTDIATRVRVIGAGTALTDAAVGSGTVVYTDSATPFAVTGGSAYVGADLITYTAAGLLVPDYRIGLGGVSGLTRDWPVGTAVRPVTTVNDTGAQSALATALGGGLSGIAVRTVDDASLSRAEAAARASADLALLSAGVPMLTGVMVDGRHTHAERCWPGATISVSLTSPVTLSGTWRIQSVTLTPRGVAGGGTRWMRAFQAAPVRRGTELLDLLESM